MAMLNGAFPALGSSCTVTRRWDNDEIFLNSCRLSGAAYAYPNRDDDESGSSSDLDRIPPL
jgi:hypothetical protein